MLLLTRINNGELEGVETVASAVAEAEAIGSAAGDPEIAETAEEGVETAGLGVVTTGLGVAGMEAGGDATAAPSVEAVSLGVGSVSATEGAALGKLF